MTPLIFGLSGPCLTPDERALFADAEPAGYILFARNCGDRAQLCALTDDLRALSGRSDLPILVDQEGGRVVRLRPPAWPELPGPAPFDRLYQRAPISAIEAMRLHGRAIAAQLREAGITVNCAPMLDLRRPEGHPVIAERALGDEPMQVAALGRALLDGMAAGGIAGIVKHMPGQGRAEADSHHRLPVVRASEEELEADLQPFRSLKGARAAMTAHVVYEAWDKERPATLSPSVIADAIRGRIAFDGLLLSDDIGMGALDGDLGERAAAALASGCDLVLHCSGDLAEMRRIAEAAGSLSENARRRLGAVTAVFGGEEPIAQEELATRRDALLAYA